MKLNKDGEKYYLDDRAYNYFSKNFDVKYLSNNKKGMYIDIKVWDNLYKDGMLELKEYMYKNQDKLIDKLQEAEINEIWASSCEGSLSTWEMDTLGFYYHEHDLVGTYHPEFKFKDYFEMSESPTPKEYIKVKGRDVPVMELQTICGTVLDKSSYKHTVILLTPTGVVNVKCVAEQYSKYDKQISQLNKETGKKEVVEKSWFRRGTKLIVNGWRNGDQFMARGRQSEGKYPFYKVIDSDDTGALNITRYRADD